MDQQALSLGVSETPAKVSMIMLWHYAISQIQEENLSTQFVIITRKTFILEFRKEEGMSLFPLLKRGMS